MHMLPETKSILKQNDTYLYIVQIKVKCECMSARARVECFTNLVYIHINVEYYINKMLKYTPVVQSLDCFTKPFSELDYRHTYEVNTVYSIIDCITNAIKSDTFLGIFD